MNDNDSYGNLSQLFHRYGLTRPELAEALSVSMGTVNNWCSGRSNMKVKQLAGCLSLLAHYGTRPSDLRRFLMAMLRREGLTEDAGFRLLPSAVSSQPDKTRRGTVLYVAPLVFTKGNRLSVLGARDYLAKIGIEMLLTSVDSDSQYWSEALAEQILGGGVTGVMVSRLRDAGCVRTIAQAATSAGIPVVGLYRKTGLEGLVKRFVWVDDFWAGYRVAEHMLKLGHRRVGFLGFDRASPTEQDRFRGYKQALTEHEIFMPPEAIMWAAASPLEHPEAWVDDVIGTRPETLAAIESLRKGRITGLFCASEPASMSIVIALNREYGIAGPPAEWALVAVALGPWPDLLVEWKFSYLLVPAYDIGRQAAKMVTIENLSDSEDRVAFEGIVQCEFREAGSQQVPPAL